ncbi:hypothetical protein [Desulfoluna spongiiphila]|uniref:Uncharacterized protein n=1 Tax=Desulfoluna spongiiphila TaxID=419481 RepID=A0A1G5IJM2_9BACT|nr:hypothetical protein [Desulfoluna spongiiphila]SCY76213.1 hypothetical protein SAMN05216233_12069 [Desulfoluna spongiiphila]
MPDKPHRRIPAGLLIFLLLVFGSCATRSVPPTPHGVVAFIPPEEDTLLSRYAPAFVVEEPEKRYNLVGTPTAEAGEDGKEEIRVDPWRATVYTETRRFDTDGGTWTNLVYRVHFQETPGGLLPYYLGKGKNVGLIVVVTLDRNGQPVLYTTVHTCGCYLAFVPTTFLADAARPHGWPKDRQTVHSENLPAVIDIKGSPDAYRLMVLLRDATHRVRNMWVEPKHALVNYRRIPTEVAPLAALETLPVKTGETTSFYETSGPRNGYVKGSHKSRERLLMSWWAFDWRVGEDKKLGTSRLDGILFYTSLKPWAREKSDMRDFPTFLRYWGWNL